jgi:hypothetical protein
MVLYKPKTKLTLISISDLLKDVLLYRLLKSIKLLASHTQYAGFLELKQKAVRKRLVCLTVLIAIHCVEINMLAIWYHN